MTLFFLITTLIACGLAGYFYYAHAKIKIYAAKTSFKNRIQQLTTEVEMVTGSYAELQLINDELKAEKRTLLNHTKQLVCDKNSIADKALTDYIEQALKKLSSKNYQSSLKRIHKTMNFMRDNGIRDIYIKEEERLREIDEFYQQVLRAEAEKEKQSEIKVRMREEKKAEQEKQKELKRLDDERKKIEKALKEAMKAASDDHNEELEALKLQLAEAEQKAQRTKSMAELTKSGHVYVISNVGSFGDQVYKIGMTRRLEPMDRVKELGDASVPFTFDVHAMISTEDAPALESELHKAFNDRRVNKVNLRKEFFHVDLDEIISKVEEHHGSIEYVVDAEALEYRETLEMEDQGISNEYSQEQEDFNED
jgi:DNA polymerase III alpha subunit (gram-positive type)